VLNIGGLEIKVPIIQGGMGVGVSLRGLASAVANEGGIGIIASVGLGLGKLNHSGNYAKDNVVALRDEIRSAREMSEGFIGVNIMHALSDYDTLVKTSVEENIDLIISGAGIPRDLPKYLNGKDIKLVPIVSSAKYTGLIIKAWERVGHRPDAIVIEGPLAGGHLGFKYEDLVNGTAQSLEEITSEVLDMVKDKIPIVVAGGIYTGADIYKFLELGASGVQMGTRFVVTDECDADIRFKQTYIDSKKEDIVLIKSPVGLPGRAVKNDFLKRIMAGERDKFRCSYQCLKSCKPNESPYCIADALEEARKGDFTKGYAFAGTNAYRCDKIIPVKELMNTLRIEYSEAAGKK